MRAGQTELGLTHTLHARQLSKLGRVLQVVTQCIEALQFRQHQGIARGHGEAGRALIPQGRQVLARGRFIGNGTIPIQLGRGQGRLCGEHDGLR